MFKILSCAVLFAQLYISSAQNSCRYLRYPVQYGCYYENPLKITSDPDNLVLEKSNCNEEFNKLRWEERPSIQYPSAKRDKTYTIVLVDPDAPGYKKGEYFLHWIMTNVPGRDLAVGDVSKGKELQEYWGPEPPEGSGVHRYIFLVFEESVVNQKVRNAEREKFSLVEWAGCQPRRLCGPVTGLQFKSRF